MLADDPGTTTWRTSATLGPTVVTPDDADVQATQRLLPFYRGQLAPDHGPRFAHPAEAQLARVFTYYGIRWAYEPTTFTLDRHPDGQPREMFTPDFYLPDHRLYVELTTMRQRLVTRKNRKVRLLNATYPNARVKLVYRRDFLRLIQTFQRAKAKPGSAEMQAVSWNEADVAHRMLDIAGELSKAFRPQVARPVILTLGAGASRFQYVLRGALHNLGLTTELGAIRLPRPRHPEQQASVRMYRIPLGQLRGRSVVLLTDVVSTGMSLRYVQDWLARHEVDVVHTCALLDRSSARLVDVRVDSIGFSAPDELLAGFGLSLVPAFARLPFIATVRHSSGAAQTD